jgi:hypothetical protein
VPNTICDVVAIFTSEAMATAFGQLLAAPPAKGELKAAIAALAARTWQHAYLAAKQRQHILDYDDLLLYWAQMMFEP